MSNEKHNIVRNVNQRAGFSYPRATAQDGKRSPNGIGFDERGLLAYLLSKPDDWIIQIPDIMAEGGIGRDKAEDLMARLRKAGYVQTEMIRDENGHFVDKIDRIFETRQPVAVKPPRKKRTQRATNDRLADLPLSGKSPTTVSTEYLQEVQNKNTPAESAGGPAVNGAKKGSRAATTGKSEAELEAEAKAANDAFIAIQMARLNEPAEREALLDAILEVFNAGGGEAGEAGMYMKMLRGIRKYKARKKGQVDEFDNQAHLFRERPVTAEELRRWAADYRAANPNANMVRVPFKVASSIDAWRAKQSTAPAATSYKDVELAEGPVSVKAVELTPEQKAENERQLAALKRAQHGR